MFRGRVDTCHYDRQQLLLGTVVFSVLFFVLPTLLAYYLLGAVLNVGICVVKVALFVGFILVRKFPYYNCILRATRSQCLITGANIILQSPAGRDSGAASYNRYYELVAVLIGPALAGVKGLYCSVVLGCYSILNAVRCSEALSFLFSCCYRYSLLLSGKDSY